MTAASAAAAGDGLKSGLLPHQLRELVVMAGLDPAATSTRQLVEQLLHHRGPAENQSRIGFDDFMKVVIYFQVRLSVVGCSEGGLGDEQRMEPYLPFCFADPVTHWPSDP